jgi:phage-related protein
MTDAELITTILNVYSFQDQEITTLSEAIVDARLLSMRVSYQHAQKVVGVPVNWEPSGSMRSRITRQSQKDAHGIATTFRNLLTSLLEDLFQVKHVASWQDIFGTLSEAVSSVIAHIKEWIRDLLPWKGQQIINASCGTGLNEGLDTFMKDLANGDIIDDSGKPLSIEYMTDYAVRVLPVESSDDICRDYAGVTFALSDYDLIPAFPVHVNCPHYKEILQR